VVLDFVRAGAGDVCRLRARSDAWGYWQPAPEIAWNVQENCCSGNAGSAGNWASAAPNLQSRYFHTLPSVSPALLHGLVLPGMRIAASDSPTAAGKPTSCVGDESTQHAALPIPCLRAGSGGDFLLEKAAIASVLNSRSMDPRVVRADRSVWGCEESSLSSLRSAGSGRNAEVLKLQGIAIVM